MITDIRRLENDAQALGLTLNHSKCEVIGLTPTNRGTWLSGGFRFQEFY